MAGVMKLACLVLACMIVAGPITVAALDCNAVSGNLGPCIGYVINGGAVIPEKCCDGVRKLNGMARTTPDRKQACNCIKNAASALGPRLNPQRAAAIPKLCGVNIPYKISTSTNCNTVK